MYKKNTKHSEVFEMFESIIVFTLVLTLLILMFFFNFSNVSGSSMEPTLTENDRVLVQIIAYTPKVGDVVITSSFINFGAPLVKRVIATGGDVVDINEQTGDVTVNGEVLNEPYISAVTTYIGDTVYPLTVPKGEVFLMGDNRPGSNDSRNTAIGCIDERDIVGKVVFRISPFNNMGIIN